MRGRLRQDRCLGPQHELTGAALATPNRCHFRREGRGSQAPVRPIPREVLDFVPDQVVASASEHLVPRSAPGPGVCTNELLRVCLGDCELLLFLFLTEEAKPFMTAHDDSFIQAGRWGSGIATGTSVVGCQDTGEAIHERSGAHSCSVPVLLCTELFAFAMSTFCVLRRDAHFGATRWLNPEELGIPSAHGKDACVEPGWRVPTRHAGARAGGLES